MMWMFTKTLAVALTGLCLASTLAFAQPSRTGAGAGNAGTTRAADAWNHVGPYRDYFATGNLGVTNPNPPQVDTHQQTMPAASSPK